VSISYDDEASRRIFDSKQATRQQCKQRPTSIWEKRNAYSQIQLQASVKKQLSASQSIPVMLQSPDLCEMEENLQDLTQRLAASQDSQRHTEAKRQVLAQQLKRCKKKLRQIDQDSMESEWAPLNKNLGLALAQSGVDLSQLQSMQQHELVDFVQTQLAKHIGRSIHEQLHPAPI
jgi:hypothetical protein